MVIFTLTLFSPGKPLVEDNRKFVELRDQSVEIVTEQSWLRDSGERILVLAVRSLSHSSLSFYSHRTTQRNLYISYLCAGNLTTIFTIVLRVYSASGILLCDFPSYAKQLIKAIVFCILTTCFNCQRILQIV